MSHAPTTPKSNSDEDGAYASWLPRDIPYNASFEDSICAILTADSPPKHTGIRILHAGAPDSPKPGISIRAHDIPSTSLPTLTLADLPLPISDPRRKYASPIPGINLTHPGGYIEGGPGIAPSDDEFARHFVLEHGVRTAEELKRTVDRELEAGLALARERMRARKGAMATNERIRREMKSLAEQMEMETKVLNKAREKAKERRERRERRKVGK